MNRRKFLTFGAAAGSAAFFSGRSLALFEPPVISPSTPSPAFGGLLDVGSRAQLFTDGMAIGKTERIAFTVHPGRKHPLNPLVKADQPWEGWIVWISTGSVLFDEQDQLFKMWYFSRSKYFPKIAMHYAFSRDGIHWEKPLTGTVKFSAYSQHNIVSDHLDVSSVFIDPTETDPRRRFKMIGYDTRKNPQDGPRAFVSADGLEWKQISNQVLFPSSDVFSAIYDRQRKLCIAFPKVKTNVRGIVRRCFGVTTSADLQNWTETRMAFVPDLRDDAGTLGRLESARTLLLSEDNPALMRSEIYGVGTYQAESCLIAFPWVCSMNNRLPSGNDDGVSEIQIAVSRDLETWERPYRAPVIPRGPVGTWDCAFVTTAVEAFRHGDEIWLYYTGQDFTHADPLAKKSSDTARKATRSIGLATWPLDRFVSADGGSQGGVLTTVPLRFTGRRLELNVNPGKEGTVRVEILDAGERAVEGYGQSDPQTKDSLRSTVAWNGSADLSQFAGKPIRLRFHLRNSELYSFAFRA